MLAIALVVIGLRITYFVANATMTVKHKRRIDLLLDSLKPPKKGGSVDCLLLRDALLVSLLRGPFHWTCLCPVVLEWSTCVGSTVVASNKTREFRWI